MTAPSSPPGVPVAGLTLGLAASREALDLPDRQAFSAPGHWRQLIWHRTSAVAACPASHRRCPRCPARHCAAFEQRAAAGNGVRTWRDHDRVAAAGADRNVTANAGTRQGHGPGPRARQPRCRAADAVEVTGQGALGGRLPGARDREQPARHKTAEGRPREVLTSLGRNAPVAGSRNTQVSQRLAAAS